MDFLFALPLGCLGLALLTRAEAGRSWLLATHKREGGAIVELAGIGCWRSCIYG